MKKKFLLFLLIFIGILLTNIKGQLKYPLIFKENISLFTDRDLYVVGEQINFSMFISNGTDFKSKVLSNVVYIELITPNGISVARGKFVVKNNLSSGYLLIPKEIITGIYYIKAYTKCMRNFNTESYAYTLLKIINPEKNELLSVKEGNHKVDSLTFLLKSNRLGEKFEITTNKKEYSTRDTVYGQISCGNFDLDSIKGLCVSVIPENAVYNQNLVLPKKSEYLSKYDYMPETRGISVTGKIVDKKTEEPISNAEIDLSIIGNLKDFMAVLTDSLGRFFFSMPDYSCNKDIYINTKDIKNQQANILIDNDFCENIISLPAPVFNLSDNERKIAYRFAVNAQVGSHFSDTSILSIDTVSSITKFYGQPSNILVLDKFIQLPTLEEYFNELVVNVTVKKLKGEKYFKFDGKYSEMEIFKPLVLVDYISVDDVKKVLGIVPENIEKIEIINSPYKIGNITYGGIISIISKKGDFAGIELPSSGMFLNFSFWNDFSNFKKKVKYSITRPDTRNTLYWEPFIDWNNKKNKKSFSFTTSDTPGNYNIVLRGFYKNGEIIISKTNFKVK